MTAQPLEQHTYLPDPGDRRAADVLSFMEAHGARGGAVEPRYFLAGAEEGDHVEIPESVHRVLLQVLEAMAAGKAVTVAPQSKLLTTQQAADLLGLSRPTVVKLIDEGQLQGETPGKRRRMVKLDEVLKYRASRREQQFEALLSEDDYYEDLDPEQADASYRAARKAVAQRHRSASATS